MRRTLMVLATTACWVSSAAALNADVEIGVLACTLSTPREDPAGTEPSGERTREALCTFLANTGVEETYTGKVDGISITADQEGTLIWVVRSPSQLHTQPGALQKVFTSDSGRSADQKPPLIGEGNAELALHSMSDKPEGSASAAARPAPSGFVILRLELKLQSSSG